MRVLNVSQSFEIRGGSDMYFNLLTELLRNNGIDVEQFAAVSSGDKVYPHNIDFDRISFKTLSKYIYNFEAKKKIRQFVKKSRFDLAHLHIYYGVLSASVLKPLKQTGMPIVQTLHEYKLVCPTYKLHDGEHNCFACKGNHFYKALSIKCNRDSFARTALSVVEAYISLWAGSQSVIDHFITVSDFQKTQIVEMGMDAARMTTIHNFVNVDADVKNTEGEYVLYFGRIEKVKGIEVLLDAFDEISGGCKLVIVGDGNFKSQMLQRVQSSPRLLANTTFLGFKNKQEMKKLIIGSKFTVVPSIWYETFGLTVVETMACGKPVIGSNIGGITEIISDGIDGFLTEPDNYIMLKEKILELWNNDALLRFMGENALEKARTKFSPNAHFEKIFQLYRRLL